MWTLPEAKTERNLALYRLVEAKEKEVGRRLNKSEREAIMKAYGISTTRYYSIIRWCKKKETLSY